MAGWTSLKDLIAQEKIQLLEEGVDSKAAEQATAKALALLEAGEEEHKVWSVFFNLPRDPNYPHNEPNELEAIRALRVNIPQRRFDLDLSTPAFADKMHGAWLGRCVGCALGKPIESFGCEHNGMQSWERIKRYLVAIDPSEWPVKDYIPKHSPAIAETGGLMAPMSTRENICCMESDDDIRYTVLGQYVMDQAGRDFNSLHPARNWLERLGYSMVCTAETQAYRNMVYACDWLRNNDLKLSLAEFLPKTDFHWITHHANPYREWIGAQIRVDGYAYAAPGDPELAADFAWRDARISHVKNGIYGAMFCAAMIAAAFTAKDIPSIIESGLAEIPQTSRLYKEMRQTIAICQKYQNKFENFEAVFKEIYGLLGHYHFVHTNNNAALCVVALLLGNGDFHKTIITSVMGGLDTDCNGATVGSIIGAYVGGKNVPAHWTRPLNNTLNSLILGYHPIPIDEAARKAVAIARKVMGR